MGTKGARTNPLAHFLNSLQSDSDVLIFLGAGSSIDGSQDDGPFPDFETLIARILRDEGAETTGDRMESFLAIIRQWERESVLSVRLASYLYGNPGISHLRLASATLSLFPQINMAMYLTTNFDDLMFKALSAVTRSVPKKDPRSFSLHKSAVISEVSQIFHAIPRYTSKGVPVIVKLFGDLGSTSPIFNPHEMPFDEFTEEKLLRLFDRTALFIGYSLRDAPILRLLIRSASKYPIFVVSPTNPVDDRIAQVSQREFHWIPSTFAEFMSALVEALSTANSAFQATFASFLKNADAGLLINSRQALQECARSSSGAARARYLSRERRSEASPSSLVAYAVARPDTAPDLDAFLQSSAKILAVVGESGSGKSTLLFEMYERRCAQSGDLCIYYDAQSFQASNALSGKLALDFAVDTATLGKALSQISHVLGEEARMIVVIDGLNESALLDPVVIRYEIENLAREAPRNVKFVFSCRRVFWEARMNLSNDLPMELYADGKLFLLSKFSSCEARSAYELYRPKFDLRSRYEELSVPLREHIRDPLMLRFISEVYRGSVLPQFAPAVEVFKEVMNALRRRYIHTPLIDFLDCLVDQRLDEFFSGGTVNDIFQYRATRTNGNLALLAQQQMAGKRHAEHPLTLLEDENIITPMENIGARFKFTYERFYEYLIGLRLHYRIFREEDVPPPHYIEDHLGRFRDSHHSFYQGLKNAFVMEYLAATQPRRREIALLVYNADRSVSEFGKDVLREIVFASGGEMFEILAAVSVDRTSITALALDLGSETEGVLPFAAAGLFDFDIDVRRRSVKCLGFHARNFGSTDKINAQILAAIDDKRVDERMIALGVVYYFGVCFNAAFDKFAALETISELVQLLTKRMASHFSLSKLAEALCAVTEIEGPLFFGANYGSDGLFYPWHEARKNVEPYLPATAEILRDGSIECLENNLDAIVALSDIRVEPATAPGKMARLFAYQIEYRLVQWSLIAAWEKYSDRVLALMDRIVAGGRALGIDFALGIVELAVFRIAGDSKGLLAECRARMIDWLDRFEAKPDEFYLALEQPDPFRFNLVPLAVLGHVEAQFFTPESGVVPCISQWLADPSPKRRKMALLAAAWLSPQFPVKILNTLEPSLRTNDLDDWFDRVLSDYASHSPRLLDEFFDRMHFPIERRIRIRTMVIDSGDVQYQCDELFAWLFLEARCLNEISAVHEAIYASSSPVEFWLTLLNAWFGRRGVAIE
jgi:SIR2-like domain